MDVQADQGCMAGVETPVPIPRGTATNGLPLQVAEYRARRCLHRHGLGRMPKDTQKHERRLRDPWHPMR